MLYCVRRTPIVVCFKSARHVTLIKHSFEYLVYHMYHYKSLYCASEMSWDIWWFRWADISYKGCWIYERWRLHGPLVELVLVILASLHPSIWCYMSTLLIREERFFMNPSSSSGEYFLVFRLAKVKEADTHFCRWLSGLG